MNTNQKKMIRSFIRFLRKHPWLFTLLYPLSFYKGLEYFVLREGIFAKSYLDLCCGEKSFTVLLPRDTHSVGVDIYEPYLEKSRESCVHKEYITADLSQWDTGKQYDAVFILNAIEHFTKDEGLKLLEKAQRIATKKVIISTPNGWTEQDERDGNLHQRHLSGWTKEDLQALGYTVYARKPNLLIAVKHIK